MTVEFAVTQRLGTPSTATAVIVVIGTSPSSKENYTNMRGLCNIKTILLLCHIYIIYLFKK